MCHGSVLRDQERIQCTVPVLAWNEAETEASQHVGRDSGLHNGGRRAEQGDRGLEEVDKKEEGREGWGVTKARVSVSVGDRAAVWAEGVAYAPNSCRSANDCDDGDFCSLDACVKVGVLSRSVWSFLVFLNPEHSVEPIRSGICG